MMQTRQSEAARQSAVLAVTSESAVQCAQVLVGVRGVGMCLWAIFSFQGMLRLTVAAPGTICAGSL